MHNCGLIDENVGPLFFACFKHKTLRKLNLSNNHITDSGLIKIAQHMKEKGDGDLHSLDLACNDEFTDRGGTPLV
jgi:Leucine-rich repeat (LRR) protein